MSTFQPDSLHPYIMDERLKKATGSGGISSIPIASAETLGGIKVPADSGITIDGSGNAYAYKPINYSTSEVNTGRKWIDGKDIYEKTIHASDVTLTATEVIDATIKSNTVDTLISIMGTVLDNEGSLYECYASTTDRVVPVVNTNGVTLLISNVTVKGYDITVQYTKPTTP